VTALIPAAGRARRFGQARGKVFADLGGRPLLARVLAVFDECTLIGNIVPIAPAGQEATVAELCRAHGIAKLAHVATGGERRQDSVLAGLRSFEPAPDIVAIHDAARPLVSIDLIERTVQACIECGAATAAVPVSDTIKEADAAGFVGATPDRSRLYATQTPQVFRYELILEAHTRAREDGFLATDDAALVERLGHRVKIVEGERPNIKVTAPEDIAMARALLPAPASPQRIGHGYDVHRLVRGRRLVLGGVVVPHELGLAGHSDADVVLHAISDAVLGAASCGDIGQHFPDTDPAFKDCSSLKLAAEVARIVAAKGLAVINIDATIIAEAPRLAPHIEPMRGKIAEAFRAEAQSVSVKATTTEGLGFAGREEGIACHAVVLLANAAGTG
jgi:2-C-methyl-D-erythritol 4-phosphate cytidylyltransferase/2-C-methyl-D-erythritol 2,4-cyclodiphosphate synthase